MCGTERSMVGRSERNHAHQAYISGPLTGLEEWRSATLKAFYEQLGARFEAVARDLGHPDAVGYVPHKFCDPVAHAHWTPDQVKVIDYGHVRNSNVMIMYVGVPSHGVGREHEWALALGIPVVALCESTKLAERTVSRLARADITHFIAFGTYDDALQEFEEWVRKNFHLITSAAARPTVAAT